MKRIALCSDAESLLRPMMIGLEGTDLSGFDWLIPISDAVEARETIAQRDDVGEAWVASTDQMAAMNLAAALHEDDPSLPVHIIAFEKNEELESRCSNLGIEAPWDSEGFCERFDLEKRRRHLMGEVASIDMKTVRSMGSSCGRETVVVPSPKKRDGCFMVPLVSGSGGVGKSSIAVIAALLTQARGFLTAIIDADAQFGCIHRMVKDGDRLPLDELISAPLRLEGSISGSSDDVPFLVTAPERAERSETIQGLLPEAISICSKRFDAVFVDMPAHWSEDHAWVLENGDRPLVVMDQTSSSMYSARHALDLCRRMGIATGSFAFLLNRCGKEAVFSALDASNVLDGADVIELRDGGIEVEEML